MVLSLLLLLLILLIVRGSRSLCLIAASTQNSTVKLHFPGKKPLKTFYQEKIIHRKRVTQVRIEPVVQSGSRRAPPVILSWSGRFSLCSSYLLKKTKYLNAGHVIVNNVNEVFVALNED